MILTGIDISKHKHFFCICDTETGEVSMEATSFNNDKDGFDLLLQNLNPYSKESLLIGMEDTGHYHFALLKYLLSKNFVVALIKPVTTELTRKLQGGISKNDKLDTLTICNVLASSSRKKSYRITKIDKFDFYEQKQ